jgi:small neutral amino acid transporter SnatA (MarC family)
LELALLPQSRGAFWTFFLVLPFFVVLSTNRFRALADLVIVLLPVALFWPKINGVYVAIRDGDPLEPALNTALTAIGYSVLIVVGMWAVTYLVERLVGPLSRRVTRWIGIVLIVLALGGAIGGLIYADMRTGGLDDYVGDRWTELTSDGGGAGSGSGSRFTGLGLNGRARMWRVAAEAFAENPVLGVGAQNYEIYYYQHRADTVEVKQPHSQPMQLLAELGLPGLLLWVAFFGLTLVRAVVLRVRAPGRMSQAVVAAMMVAMISWLIHSSADWLWQIAATSLPAVMLAGGLVGAGAVRQQDEAAAQAPEAPSRRRERTSTRSPRRLHMTRPVLTVLALAVLVSAALPYLSLRYCDLASGAEDLDTMTARTKTAAALDPTSVLPFAVRAGAYKTAAGHEPEGSLLRVGLLTSAAAAWAEATERESSSWLCFFKAAEMSLAARDAALAAGVASADELERSARSYLNEARRLSPLSPQIDALELAF